jgi:capsule polysaccharide export protein KpsE/RkpR
MEKQEPVGLTEVLLRIISNDLKHIKLCLFFVLLPTIVVFVMVMWVIQPTYRVTAVITPPPASTPNVLSGFSSMLGDMGSGVGSLLGLSDNNDDIGAVWTIFNSWQLHNQVIEKYHLKEHYKFKGKFHADLLKEFRKNFGFEKNKEDLFSVSIEDEDYHLAAEMLRFILAKADSAFNAFKTSQARQSRIYFQSRLDSCERVMDSLLVSFAQFQVDNNFYDPEVQLEATIKYMGELQAKREEVAMEMSFEKMNRGEDSKRYDELNKRYRGVTNALNSTLEGKRGEVGVLSLKKSPALGVEYLRRESELKIQETLYKLLRQQSEQMRLEEAKMLTNLHILEPPWENNKKVAPLRGVSLIFTVMVSSLFVTFLCNFIEFMKAETARGSRVADDWASITRFFRRKSKKKA